MTKPRTMRNWTQAFQDKRRTPAAAIQMIPRGKHILIGSGAAEPVRLVEELVAQSSRFSDNQIVHLMTLGPAPYVDECFQENFRHNAFFIGANVREAVRGGLADYTPVFLSQVPGMIRSRRLPVDVALIQVSAPDPFGYVNLGISVDIVQAAVESAKLVIAEINPRMPMIYGSGFVQMSEIDAWIYRDAPLLTVPRDPPDEVSCEIGRLVATLVDDRSTLQFGIGQIPDAVAAALRDKKDLAVWTEMLPDGVVDLVKNGNVTGRYATLHPHKVMASFTFGSQSTYEFVNRNPAFEFKGSDYINDPINISRQNKMVAINGALQIDLTGQVCADSIGSRFYSGIGGQVDFIRGASMCPGGKPVIATRSTAKNGEVSRIVASLSDGAGVVTSRGDVHYVVTEFGIADLLGKTIRERAMALISIAHPDHRSELLTAAKARRYVFADQFEPRRTQAGLHRKKVSATNGSEVLLRPIEVVDEQKMSDLFYTLSASTIHRRWMSTRIEMHHAQLQRYLDVDDRDNIAIVVEAREGGRETEIVGVGRYHRDHSDQTAEVAFLLRDDWQGLGLGTALLLHLADIGRKNGVVAFKAEVLAENDAMMSVFRSMGPSVKSDLRGDIYSVNIPLLPPGNAPAG